MAKIEICGKANVTPELMAELFWNFDSDQQAAFFRHLAKQGTPFKREVQWWHLEKTLKAEPTGDAKEALMDLAAPLYLNVLMATGVNI